MAEQTDSDADRSRYDPSYDECSPEELLSLASHELQNPLNVAQLQLTLISDDYESEHLVAAQRALDRMDTIITDFLKLTPTTQELDPVSAVDLTDVSEQCWRYVGTDETTLTVDTARTVRADRPRLEQLLQNLLQNALEHGGEDVTVTVGELDDRRGFYVEDDGSGIPEADREEVFTLGYSTSHSGTGFGLYLVAKIAQAHGWNICLAEGSDGGARFEITGVEFVDSCHSVLGRNVDCRPEEVDTNG